VRFFLLLCASIVLSSCGFHLQGEAHLAKPLHKIYLQTPDPYGAIPRDVVSALKMSHVQLVTAAKEADTILVLSQETITQTLLSVSGTQQTRQYNLIMTVQFEITDKNGGSIVPLQTLAEGKVITVQSDQILGSSNEATLYYQQMRRSLAHSIMNRIASKEITTIINRAFSPTSKHKKPT
jgi:LPS-assembly lipoprotein